MIAPLRAFVAAAIEAAGPTLEEAAAGVALHKPFARLIADDHWLPDQFARPHPEHHQQYLLYGDPLDRFSVVSFVWGPGQSTPIHDHGVWGIVGVLRGAEIAAAYARPSPGEPMRLLGEERLEARQFSHISPLIGDVHSVRNAYADRVSISIHVYGGNIGTIDRRIFDPETGASRPFRSGYSSGVVPNLWS